MSTSGKKDIDLYHVIFLDMITFDKMWRLKIMRCCPHFFQTLQGRGKSPRRKGQHTDFDTWPCMSKLMYPPTNTHASMLRRNMRSPTMFLLFIADVCQSHSGSPASTKILYFTGKSPTPSMINIPKRSVYVCIEVCVLYEEVNLATTHTIKMEGLR